MIDMVPAGSLGNCVVNITGTLRLGKNPPFFLNIKSTIMKSPSLAACVFTGTRVGIRYEIMLLMTGSSGLCFRKAAYQQFVAEGECICSQW